MELDVGEKVGFLIERKIDTGKILKRFRMKFDKISFPGNEEFNSYDLYQIWFSFFDPALRVSLLKKMLCKKAK